MKSFTHMAMNIDDAARSRADQALVEVVPANAKAGVLLALRAIQAMNPQQDNLVILKMSNIFSGLLKMSQQDRTGAKRQTDEEIALLEGTIALTKNEKEIRAGLNLTLQAIAAMYPQKTREVVILAMTEIYSGIIKMGQNKTLMKFDPFKLDKAVEKALAGHRSGST